MPEEMQQQTETSEQIAAPAEGTTASESAAEENEQQGEREGSEGGQAQKSKGGFQRRIDQLTRENGDTARERDFWKKAAMEGKTPEAAKPELKETPKPAEKPVADNFNTQDEYLEALADWKLDQREAKQAETRRVSEAEQQRATVKQEFSKKLTTFREATADFEDTLAGIAHIPASPAVVEEIDNHEHGPELLYFLGKHPDIAEKLATMSPTQVAREIGRLEPRFVPQRQAQEGGEQAATARTVSQAPKPATPVGKSGSVTQKDPDKMTAAEWMKERRKLYPKLK